MAKTKKSAPISSSNTPMLIGGAVLLIVVAAAFFLMRGDGGMVTEPLATPFTPADLQRAQGIAMGDDSAPVQLYEFADYQCPHCAQFATFIHPLIKQNLVDPGLVRLVRYDFPLSMFPHSFLAARASRCAGDTADQYWEYHDILYGRQRTWSSSRNPARLFISYAEELGLNRREFQACLRSDRHAEEVTRNLRLAESLGVTGTPTLMLNGQIMELQDYQDLERQVLEAAGLAPEPAPAG